MQLVSVCYLDLRELHKHVAGVCSSSPCAANV